MCVRYYLLGIGSGCVCLFVEESRVEFGWERREGGERERSEARGVGTECRSRWSRDD